MKWPQVVMIALYAVSFAIEAQRHGEPKTGKHNVWAATIGIAIGVWVLRAGGFWK